MRYCPNRDVEIDMGILIGSPVLSGQDQSYYDLLVADSHFELSKAFTLSGAPNNDPQQQIEDTYLVSTSGAYDSTQWNYDATEDAAAWLWLTESSKPTGDQLRWGNTTSYNEKVPVSFGQIDDPAIQTMFFVWDWKFGAGWNIEDRDLDIPDVLNNHKAHQLSTTGAPDNRFLEPRHRFTGASNQFPGPSGAQVCNLDFRTYAGPTSGAGGSVPSQLATVYPKAGQWFRWLIFCDYPNLEISAWAHLDDGSLVQMHDKAGGFTASSMQYINNFWHECNSSQDGGSGVTSPSYMYSRNWVVLNGLTYAEAVALAAQSSW